MILDQLDNHHLYPYGEAWQVAFDFLRSLNTDAEEKRYALQGDEIYAAIESYDTRMPSAALRPEAHRRYIDIQVLLSGTEQITCWPTQGLTVTKPYSPEADIAFFDQPDAPGTALQMEPGRFAVFFPDDAHMPCLQIAGPGRVKKVVVKIAAELV